MNKITTSSAAAQLERMYDDLNKAFFEGKLPDAIITLKCTKGAYGHFTTGQIWRVDESTHKHEINISSATLDRPALQTAATLLLFTAISTTSETQATMACTTTINIKRQH